MQDTISIRRVIPADLDKLVSIEKNCFPDPQAYSKKQIRYLITRAKSISLVECANDEIRGFIIALIRLGSQVAGVETLNVHPTHRGQGIAMRLLRSTEETLPIYGIRSLRLEVSTGNTAAIRLYEKAGYKTASVLYDYYQNPYFGSRNAYRMIKYLIT